MKKFTLYTETKDNLSDLASKHLGIFTLVHGDGIWGGVPEKSTQVIVIAMNKKEGRSIGLRLIHLAHEIKAVNNQQAVLITSEAIKAVLV